MRQAIPVYLFTGFLESGKTTFARDTVMDPDFHEGEKTLVIACEEGIEEYEEDMLESVGAVIEFIENEKDITNDLFNQFAKKHNPKQVILEYNGTWDINTLLDLKLPRGWVWAEVLSTIDATTFENYMANMRAIMLNQVGQSDVIVFNRCTDDTPKGTYARQVKGINRKAKFIFENEDGSIDNNVVMELPYDLSQDEFAIEDDDYGIWYVDAMDAPEKYAGKTVTFKAKIYRKKELGASKFVPGRHVMTCCADDITFLGYICKCEPTCELKLNDWAIITAEIKAEFVKEYGEVGPVLYLKKFEKTTKPKEDLIYL